MSRQKLDELVDDKPALWGMGIGAGLGMYAHAIMDKYDLASLPWTALETGLGGLAIGGALGLVYKGIRNYQIKREE